MCGPDNDGGVVVKLEFENIDSHHQRARVPGGWLVKAYEEVTHATDHGNYQGWDLRIAMTFVPDPNHEWTIDEETTDAEI